MSESLRGALAAIDALKRQAEEHKQMHALLTDWLAAWDDAIAAETLADHAPEPQMRLERCAERARALLKTIDEGEAG